MPKLAVEASMEKADVDEAGVCLRVPEGKVVDRCSLGVTLTVNGHSDFAEHPRLGLARGQQVGPGRQAKLSGDDALGVVITLDNGDRDAGLAPAAVIEISGNTDEMRLMLDGINDDRFERRSGRIADRLDRRVVVGD
jgi:hypothetical protein